MSDDLVLQAERIVLGTCMSEPAAIETVAEMLTTGDFRDQRHGTLYACLIAADAAGEPADPIAVADRLRRGRELTRAGGLAYLHTVYAAALPAANVTHYARMVADAAALRGAVADAERLTQIVETGDVEKVAAEKARLVETWTATASAAAVTEVGGRELDAFLDTDLPTHDWVIPGLLERQDRVILTGPEGKGKSTLLRQVAVMCAAGRHPFNPGTFNTRQGAAHRPGELQPPGPPWRCVHSAWSAGRQIRRRPWSSEVRTEGLDLLNRDDGDWFLALDGRSTALTFSSPAPCTRWPAATPRRRCRPAPSPATWTGYAATTAPSCCWRHTRHTAPGAARTCTGRSGPTVRRCGCGGPNSDCTSPRTDR